jgi:glucosamine--fructose-6-phosphate aminotransferase (isomerizing)
VFRSATDTEVLAHLIEAIGGARPGGAPDADGGREGTYGIAALDARQPDRIVAAAAARWSSDSASARMFVASDVAALVRYTEQVVSTTAKSP